MRARGRKGKARFGLLTIVDDEFVAAQNVFGTTSNLLGTPYFVTPIEMESGGDGRDFEVLLRQSSERTNIPASEAARDLLEDFRPDFVFLVGIAGGMTGRDGLRVGDVVVPNFIHYGEIQKLVNGEIERRFIPHDHPSMLLHESYVMPLASSYAEEFPGVRPEGQGPARLLSGSLVAGEKLWGDPANNQQEELLRHFSDSLAVDMESMGVARAVFSARRDPTYNAQFLVIRGISDSVDAPIDPKTGKPEGRPMNNEERKVWRAPAAHAAAHVAQVLVSMFQGSSPVTTARGD